MQDLLRISEASLEDLEKIVSLEQHTREAYETIQFDNLNFYQDPYVIYQLHYGEKLIGFAVFLKVFPEIELLYITIHRDFQNKGYGYFFLMFLIKELQKEKYQAIFLEVRISNIIAINLYKKIGFYIIARRKDYYSRLNGREDAWVFKLELTDHEGKVNLL